MKAITPFLPHLSGHLFGRPARSAQSRIREELERIRGASLGKLTALFGNYTSEKYLAPADTGKGSRIRMFSTYTTFWAFLAQVLTVDGSCREALRKLQAWQAAQGLPVSDSSTSAYCQAFYPHSLILLDNYQFTVINVWLNKPCAFAVP